MARPAKQGLDYFPLDTYMDDKIKLIEAEFGLMGFAVVVKLFQKIYGEHGYFCEWTNEVALVFSSDNGLGASAVSEILSASIRRGIFDAEKFERYQILTSRGIQKRYFEAVKRRSGIEVEKTYLLVEVNHNSVIVNNNSINVNNNSINADSNSQKKRKEIKRNKKKINNNVNDINSLSYDFQRAAEAAKNAGLRYIPSALNELVEEYGCDLVIRAIKEESSVDGFVTMHMVRERVKDLKGENND